MEKRESLGSRLGFILLSAGCAIGLGNVWTFPWRVGNNGGGAFVLVYIIALIVLGVPVMTAEFSIGRGAQVSPLKMFNVLEKPGQKWHLAGPLALIGNVALMMFYTTIAGYFYHYLVCFLKGNTSELTFANTLANTGVNVGCMILVVVIGFFVLSFSLQGGLEKVNKYMMLALFVLLCILAIHSLTLEGAKEGVAFYLTPDLSKINGSVVVAAMKQAFFSLSLGQGSMAIFGSYIKKDRSLLGESVNVIALDTFVALMAGFIIFPACFTYGINPDAGPKLLFTTMTTVFNDMNGGRIWGALFFLFMIFASMSTVFAVFENILTMVREMTGWSRKKGCVILCIVMIALCMPMALEGNVLKDVLFFSSSEQGLGFLDLWAFVVETIVQPLGSVIYLVFATRRFGWGWENFLAETNAGKGMKVGNWMKFLFGFVAPIIIACLWIYGLVTYPY